MIPCLVGRNVFVLMADIKGDRLYYRLLQLNPKVAKNLENTRQELFMPQYKDGIKYIVELDETVGEIYKDGWIKYLGFEHLGSANT